MYNACQNGHKTGVQEDKVTIKKSTYNSHYIPKKKHSPYQKCSMLTLPLKP